MAEQESQPATRLVVNRVKFLELAGERGFRNVEEIAERSRQEGKAISPTTIYAILQNSNYHRDSLEKLGEVTGIALTEFVTFETLPEGPRRG